MAPVHLAPRPARRPETMAQQNQVSPWRESYFSLGGRRWSPNAGGGFPRLMRRSWSLVCRDQSGVQGSAQPYTTLRPTVYYGTVLCTLLQYIGTVHATVRHGTARHGTRYSMARSIVQYSTVHCRVLQSGVQWHLPPCQAALS